MTCAEFRSTPKLVAEMRKLLENETLKTWIEAFRSDPLENPVKKPAPVTITPHGAYIMLGEQTGWNMCLDRFELGGKPLEQPKDDAGEQSYAEPADKD